MGITVLGTSIHYGRYEGVALRAVNGAPAIVGRWSASLATPGVPESPYHHEATRLPLESAEALIVRVRAAVALRCRASLAEARDRYGVGAVAIVDSPFASLPATAAEVLASWPLTCAADGMLYREALAGEARAMGLDVVRYPRTPEAIAYAASRIGCGADVVDGVTKGFGRAVGRPWRKDHREAAAVALAVLAAREPVRVVAA